MNRNITRIVILVLANSVAQSGKSAEEAPPKSPVNIALAAGEKIFLHEWQVGQPASPGGDGLGPVHNDVSCVACHNQGGVGGGGPIEKNVSMLSLGKRPPGISEKKFHRSALQIHPGFESSSIDVKRSLVLHKFSTDPAYNIKRMQFVGTDIPVAVSYEAATSAERLLAAQPVRAVPNPNGLPVRISQRNSPSLFGAGLIDQVPSQLLFRIEKLQATEGKVSGRVSKVEGGIGRFGWRAQTARLQQFVRDACANEVGLQVPGADQALHPLNVDYKPKGFDLNAAQLASLTMFVATLSRPSAATPVDERLHKLSHRGRQLFAQIGCVDCHIETLGASSSGLHGIYSDLLLHDMGPKLADPVLPTPKTMMVKKLVLDDGSDSSSSRSSRSSSSRSKSKRNSTLPSQRISSPTSSPRRRFTSSGGGSYGGGGRPTIVSNVSPGRPLGSAGPLASPPRVKTKMVEQVVPTNLAQEWRTPPLWGVSATAPYLHDGRASTLVEAILYHGGEALPAVKNFLRLSPADRTAVVEFLKTLEPPEASSI